jgi:hypothetical protein
MPQPSFGAFSLLPQSLHLGGEVQVPRTPERPATRIDVMRAETKTGALADVALISPSMM